MFQTRWEACCIAAGRFQTAFYCALRLCSAYTNEMLENDGFIANFSKEPFYVMFNFTLSEVKRVGINSNKKRLIE
jgi:hypothetical protein